MVSSYGYKTLHMPWAEFHGGHFTTIWMTVEWNYLSVPMEKYFVKCPQAFDETLPRHNKYHEICTRVYCGCGFLVVESTATARYVRSVNQHLSGLPNASEVKLKDMGKIKQQIATNKHNKIWAVCISLAVHITVTL